MKLTQKIRAICALMCVCLLLGACLTGCGRQDTYRVAVFAYKFDASYIATVRSALEKYFAILYGGFKEEETN